MPASFHIPIPAQEVDNIIGLLRKMRQLVGAQMDFRTAMDGQVPSSALMTEIQDVLDYWNEIGRASATCPDPMAHKSAHTTISDLRADDVVEEMPPLPVTPATAVTYGD